MQHLQVDTGSRPCASKCAGCPAYRQQTPVQCHKCEHTSCVPGRMLNLLRCKAGILLHCHMHKLGEGVPFQLCICLHHLPTPKNFKACGLLLN